MTDDMADVAGEPITEVDEEGFIIIRSSKPPRGDEDTQRQFGMAGRRTKYDRAAERTHLGPVRLTEVTSKIFAAMQKGEICRYGTTGWILRCPQCANLIIMEDDVHKTFVSRDGSYYRLVPSLVCPAQGCDWHVFATVVPETDIEEPEKDDLELEDKDEPEVNAKAANGDDDLNCYNED